MLQKISGKLINAMIQQNTIKEESRELYSFGIRQGIILLGNLITVYFIGWCFGMTWQALLYLIFYMPVRIYSGGYHARTQRKCYLFSCLMLGVVLIFMHAAGKYTLAYIGATVVAGIVLLKLSPVEDRNKPLDDVEELVYRRRAHIAVMLELLICIICVWTWEEMFLCVSSAIVSNAFMVLTGYAANQRIAAKQKKE